VSRYLQSALGICAFLATAALWLVALHANAMLDTGRIALWNVGAIAYNSQPTIQHVNAATDVWAQASLKQAAAADALLRDLRVISWRLDRSFLKLDTVLDTSNEQIKHVGPLLDSVKGATDAVPRTLSRVNMAVDESRGTLEALTLDADAIHARITDRRVDALLDDLRSMTGSGAGILADGKQVADKSTADYMKAHTPWGRVSARLWGGYDILAWAAGHRTP